MQKAVGTFGVFATAPASGMTVGVSNANSPARARGPLTRDAGAHNAAVRAYFTNAGLSDAQIAAVSAQAAMQGGGADGATDGSQAPTLDFYFSTVSRHARPGLAIVDSYAWARINADSDVVMESVFWPEIPANVLKSAENLSGTLGSAMTRSAFLARIPHDAEGEFEKGTVVIRHTSGVWPGSFAAYASYDVRRGTKAVHYDPSGAAFEMVDESNGALGSSKAMVSK